MPRGIRYKIDAAAEARIEAASSGRHYRGASDSTDIEVDPENFDPYLERLVKYVPAEVIAFFIPAVAVFGGDDTHLTIMLILGTVLTPIVRWVIDMECGLKIGRVRCFGYVFATVAFWGWALGTSNDVAELLTVSQNTAAFIFTVLAFSIPWIDRSFDSFRTAKGLAQ